MIGVVIIALGWIVFTVLLIITRPLPTTEEKMQGD